MKMNLIILSLFLFAGGAQAETPQASTPAPGGIPEQGSAAPPNVVWIVLDACRHSNLSCYGYERETSPAIDGLAQCGVLFESNFAQGLWTPVSVSSYMSGRYYPAMSTDPGGVIDPRVPPAGEMLFPEILKKHGYRTCCITTQIHVGPHTRLGKAFDECLFVSWPTQQDKPYLDGFMPLVLEKLSAQPSPYFMYLHLMGPHFPHVLTPPYDRWIEDEDVGRIGAGGGVLPDGSIRPAEGKPFTDDEKKHLANLYDGSISRTDHAVGALLEKLGGGGMAENTLVVISSDHGEQLGEDGYTLGHGNTSDDIMQVPLIITGPGVPEGKRVSEFTENVDIVPTLCDLLGIRTRAVFDGRSLLPLMTGGAHPERQHVVTIVGSYESRPGVLVRNRKYKCVYDNVSGDMSLLSCPDKVTARTLVPPTPELRKEFMDIIDREIKPRWKRSLSLGKKYIDVDLDRPEVLEQLNAHNLRAREDANGQNPGHWSQTIDGITHDAAGCADSEPLPLDFRLPSRKYKVYAKLHSSQNAAAGRNIAVKIKAGTMEDYQTVSDDPRNAVTENTGFCEVGAVDVKDGLLNVSLLPVEGDVSTSACKFRLVEDDSPAGVADGDRIELLKALGYL